jgi:hypothetical protein
MTWAFIKEVFSLGDIPRFLQEFSEVWLHGKGPLPIRVLMFLFAGFAWTLWITRNKMAIERQFPKAPTDILYNALSLMHIWLLPLKEADKWKVSQVKKRMLHWLRSFNASAMMPTDVFEI